MGRIAFLIAAVAAALPCASIASEPDAEALERDVRALAHDSMEGREAGTPGYERAAGYVAGRFASLGLQPGGEKGSFFQAVPMDARMPGLDAEAGTMSLSGRGFTGELPAQDFNLLGTAPHPSGTIEAPLVFIGYGFSAPGYARDDLAGLDLEGKIAVYLNGVPAGIDTEEAAYYRKKLPEQLSERGVVGLIRLYPPSSERINPFARLNELAASNVSITWIEPDGTAHSTAPGLHFTGTLSPALSERLMASQPTDWRRISKIDAAKTQSPERDSDAMRSFDMGVTARVTWNNRTSRITSNNVIGLIRGTDPALADEYVVLTGHLDHLGIRPTAEEGDDEIYNGATDNAVGIASLIDVGRRLAADPPRRPVLLLALTGEEKGLMGSDYFAANPTVPIDSIVASVNLDMPILTYAFEDVVAFGAERSTLLPVIQAAATRTGIRLSPDPLPEEGLFTRSDHYSLVIRGVPSVFLMTGFANGGEAGFRNFLATDYHKPSDEIGLVDFAQLARFAEVNYEIARGIADVDARPVWNKGDFFGTLFRGPMAD